MNFLGHVHVALRFSDDPEVLLGAILPDIESLLGPVLTEGRDEPSVAEGIAIHRRTDVVFHADRRFISGSISLTRALQRRAISRGPSRGVGHAGWELLLDGVLSGDETTTAGFGAAISELEHRAAPGSLAAFASRPRAEPIWAGYRDAAQVAARLHRQLATRPRLAFPSHQLPIVADELAAAQHQIKDLGATLADEVARLVLAG